MSATDTLEELQQQLHDNQATLTSINELLQLEADNTEYQTLYNDTIALIQSIEQLIHEKQSNETKQLENNAVQHSNGTNNSTASTINTQSFSEPPLKKSRWSTQQPTPPTVQPTKPTVAPTVNDQIQAAIRARLLKTTTPVLNTLKHINYQVDQRVTCTYTDNKNYTAVIQSVPTDSNDTVYNVLWLDFGTTSDIDVSNIHEFKPLDYTTLKPNALIRAIYPDDQLLHDAVYLGTGQQYNTVSVKFTKKKRTLDVSVFDIVDRPAEHKGINGSLALDESIETTILKLWPNCTADNPVVPQHLQINDNDTSDTQQHKRKKLKRYKLEWAKTYTEIAVKKQQQNWSNFKTGVNTIQSKKKILPTSMQQKSIFTSNKAIGPVHVNNAAVLQRKQIPHTSDDIQNDSND